MVLRKNRPFYFNIYFRLWKVMSMKQISFVPFLFFLLSIVLLTVGCGPKRPQDMPKTYPTVVKITKKGEPIPGVAIAFFKTDSVLTSSAISGVTGPDGIAHIRTIFKSYTDDGVPEGTYELTAHASVKVEDLKTPEEIRAMSISEQAQYEWEMDEIIREIPPVTPPQWNDRGTLQITVGKEVSENTLEIEATDYYNYETNTEIEQ